MSKKRDMGGSWFTPSFIMFVDRESRCQEDIRSIRVADLVEATVVDEEALP